MRSFLVSLAVAIALIVVGGLIFIYSGVFDVAASDPHWPMTRWVFDTVRIRSIKAHATGIETPPELDDPAKLVVGTEHFAAHCAVCHGAPGVPKGDIARGLNPQPPDLKEISALYTPPELLWILKHGIRMTGMPSWSDHSDEELWATVAFIEKLPGMTPEEYGKLVMASIAQGGHQHHSGGEPSGAGPAGSEQAISPNHPGPALSIGGAIRQVLPSLPQNRP
jgi:mono/diheme cytochrome c family protein